MNRESIIAAGGLGFIQAIEKDRYDTVTRLVYSDWLEERGFDDECSDQRYMASPKWIKADKWLRDYAIRLNPYELNDRYADIHPAGEEAAFQLLLKGLREKYLFAHGSDLHSLQELDDAEELREHAEVWLRQEINWNEFEFTCSC